VVQRGYRSNAERGARPRRVHSGWLVCGLVAAFYAWLVFLAVRAHRHYPFCDDW